MRTPNTLVELLRARTDEQPNQVAYTFLTDGEFDRATATHADLDRQAQRIAALLQQTGVPEGERALLLYPPGLEYIAGFFGCLYAGIVAVPAYPPDPGRLNRTLPRIRAIVADAKASVVLTTAAILPMAELVLGDAPELQSLAWLATDDLGPELDGTWRVPDLEPHRLAFLQYTSGSTGTPRGVMLTHDNLLHNARMISHAFDIQPDSHGVSWLPPYHDMGLIGGILQPLYVGRPTTLFSPLAFLQRPMRWLRAISLTRATISGGANFAFDLCVRKATEDDIASLDLNCWVTAFCGAEPVRAETLDRFARKFEPCGFRPEAFYPCYGLAEATLLVSGGRNDAAPIVGRFDTAALEAGFAMQPRDEAPARTLVGCGTAQLDQEIVIADADRRTRCEPGQIGEIWVTGPSVAKGYWLLEQETNETFRAKLVDDDRYFLRTGDLGFMDQGELFVAGRLKDLVIIRGRNCYPQDIEMTVEGAHGAMRPGCGAAFSVESAGGERLVVVQELERRYRPDRRVAPRTGSDRRQPDPEVAAFGPASERPPELAASEIVDCVRQVVAEHHQLEVSAVVLVKAGTIPKTSSGKVQRHACRDAFLEGTLEALHEWRNEAAFASESRRPSAGPVGPSVPVPAEHTVAELTNWLVSRVAKVVRLPTSEIDPRRPITRYGLDSLQSVELQNEIETHLGVILAAAHVLGGPSIVELANEIVRLQSRGREAPIERAPADAEKALSFAQERMWFLYQLDPGSPSYNIGASIRWKGPLDVPRLERAISEIVRRHEVLRTTFSSVEGRPAPVVAPTSAQPISVVDLTAEPAEEREAIAVRVASDEAQTPFDLTTGPVHRWTLVRIAPDDHVLIVIVHHIAADGWSMNVLVRELATIYESLSLPEPSPLPELPIQYADYARWERNQLQGETLSGLIAYWTQALTGAPQVLELPFDRPRPAVQTFRGARETFVVGHDVAEELRALSRREGVTFYMTLLAAFEVLLHHYTGEDDLVVGSVIANRNRAQLEGIIGFFANTLAIRVEMPAGGTFRDLLHRVSSATLAAYAHQDLPFERLVVALGLERDPARVPLVQVVFVLQTSPPPLALPGISVSTAELDTHAARFDLLVEAWESESGLLLSFEYATDLFDASTMAKMARHYDGVLQEIAADPNARIDDIAAAIPAQTLEIAITATFTAEPVEPALRMWLDRLRIPASVKFAPYNQVFQQLLDPESVIAQNAAGVNVLLIRLEDWSGPGVPAQVVDLTAIEENATAFVTAVEAHRRASTTLAIIAFCPPSDAVARDPVASRRLADLMRSLIAKLRTMKNVYALDLEPRILRYGVRAMNDPHTDELGHIPYTEGTFNAIGAALARRIFTLGSPYRAVLVEADGLLWEGAASGPGHVAVEPSHRRVQEFLTRLRATGVKLALTNRGEEAKSFDVFRAHPDMPLMLRHLQSWRINEDKAGDNLAALADELRLSPPQIVFLSANADRRAEVRTAAPEVLVLDPPAEPAEVAEWLEHVWAFDVDDANAASTPNQPRAGVPPAGAPRTPSL